MKKLIAAAGAVLLAVLIFAQASFALAAPGGAEDEELLFLEHTDVGDYSFFAVLAGEDFKWPFPQWLLEKIMEAVGEDSAGEPSPHQPAEAPEDGTAARDDYTPQLYKPYAVTKTKRYYDKNGSLAYSLFLQGVFVQTPAGVYCLQSTADHSVMSGSWRIEDGKPAEKDGVLTAEFTVTQLFTGVPVKTQKVALSLTAADKSSLPAGSGDMNGDGRVTAADARLALRAAVRLVTPTPQQLFAADMDGDGRMTAADARLILRKAVRLN